MSDENRHESESEERCDERWHKHHHKHHKGGWSGGPMMGGPIMAHRLAVQHRLPAHPVLLEGRAGPHHLAVLPGGRAGAL